MVRMVRWRGGLVGIISLLFARVESFSERDFEVIWLHCGLVGDSFAIYKRTPLSIYIYRDISTGTCD
jgi:hypothetical protein